MTQPPEYRPERTETEIVEDALLAALKRIRDAWGHMLPEEAPGRRIRSSRSTPSGIVGSHGPADLMTTKGPSWSVDHTTTDGDIDPLTRVVSLRALVTAHLNAWCRVVMEDRPVTNPATLPPGDDALAMVTFLERHAQWLSGHEAATDMLDELTEDAAQCARWADPYRREWHTIGACPFVVDDGDTAHRFCHGRVRVHIADETDDASCSDCGREAMVEWWETVLGIEHERILTPAEAAQLLASRLGVEVTERTVRNWARTGRVTPWRPFGPEPDPDRPRWFFHERDLLDEVARMDRECVLCGTIHSGTHSLCLRCLSTTWRNTPAYAEEKAVVGHDVVRREPRRRPHPTEQGLTALVQQLDTWCDFGDLPAAWCGCGRHARS